MAESDICFMTATDLRRRIGDGELSARQVMEAHLRQIERTNRAVNAMVTLTAERALEQAQDADQAQAHGRVLGPLHGLPVAHKDLFLTKGVRTTFGSLVYRDFVPEQDALIVERLRRAGAIAVGKTNTPEFGAGSQTFNELFGATRNPYDPSKTCGGSSGGAAAALACGMVPIADGSDMGGSLRNPAAFCNVVGLRPAAGRVPHWPTELAWATLSVPGPMARTVQDVALMLSAVAGPDPRCPVSISAWPGRFARPLARDFSGVRLAWCSRPPDFPVDTRVVAALDRQRPVLESLGCITEDAWPDFSDADFVFQVLRAWTFEAKYGRLLEGHGSRIKDTVVWNIGQGQKLTGPEIGLAERRRTELHHRVCQFMEGYEFLVLPTTQVPPFDVNKPYVTEIEAVEMDTYIDWMRSCYYISVTGLPAISVPCGFTDDGLPVGMQIVGRPRDEWGVLQLAYAFQESTGFWRRRPPLAEPADQ